MAKKFLAEQTSIAAGAFLLAVGVNVFLAPNKISAGGISSVGTVLLYLFGIKMSVTTLLFNAVLFAVGYKFLGKRTVLKSIAGILYLSLFLEVTLLLPSYTQDLFIGTLLGGVFMGAGVGLVVKKGASTGGSDFAALILGRFFPHVSPARFILCIDGIIILAAGIVFRSFTVTAYSALALYVSSKVTDALLVLGDKAKVLYVLSEKNEEIAREIMEHFQRGVTAIYGKGMYSGKNTVMLYCVLSPKQLPHVIRFIRTIDSSAFVVIHDAVEVLGEGFKAKSSFELTE
ncbi:MAG: YitT family protein [Eubacteriales bacterium]